MEIPGWIKGLVIILVITAVSANRVDGTITITDAFEIIGLSVVLAIVLEVLGSIFLTLTMILISRMD